MNNSFENQSPEGEMEKVLAHKSSDSAHRLFPLEPQTSSTPISMEQWTQLIPIPFDNQQAPPIPPDILPGIIAEYAAAVAESVQVPFELPLVNAIGAVAAVVQRKFKIQMHIGYSEPLNIFALACLAPGERKSAAKDACRFPLLEWEEEQKKCLEQDIKQAKAEQQVQEEAIKTLLAAVKKCKNTGERRAIARQLVELKEEAQSLPIFPRLLADDTTPEALAALMALHDQKITLMEAEGGFFDILSGRYSNGMANLDAVLKSWSGEAIRIDRRHAEPIILDSPTLSLILSVQPDVLMGAALTPSFRGRGLLGRLLFFIPQSRLGSRIIETTPIPDALTQRYRSMLFHLLELRWNSTPQEERIPYLLGLSDDAKATWLEFAEQVELSLAEGGHMASMRDWGGKLPGQVLRLAGLCHVTLHQLPQQHLVSATTMASAIHLGTLLVEHAKIAFGLLGVDDAIECARAILKWITQERLQQFSKRQCLEKVKGRWPKMILLEPGLTVLEERGYIRPIDPVSTKGGPGRRSYKYMVNPNVFF